MESVIELGLSAQVEAVALWEECGLTRPWNDPDADFARAVSGPASAVLGLYEAEVLIGTAMVGGDGHRGWAYYVAASPARQREGIGNLLMAAAENWLRARGIPKVHVMVRRSNTAVLGFYDQLGYEEQDVVVLGKRF